MQILEKVLNKIILEESVSIADVNDALDNHKRVIINYHTKGEDKATGARVIEVYAYGLTKAGNPVIRSFEPYGDSTTRVPAWKFFRLDRISSWKETNQTFDRPASFFYKGLGEFNPNDDETMSVVYKIAKFGNNTEQNSDIKTPQKGPKMKTPQGKSDDVFKTDTEHRMDRLRQQLNNPITIDDLKAKEAFKNDNGKPTDSTGPRKKTNDTSVEKSSHLYKTDTERGIENLMKQLENPKKIDLDTLRNRLGDTSKPIKYADLVKRMSQENDNSDSGSKESEEIQQNAETSSKKSDNLYKTDTERNMERLKQQLNNPKKINLSQFSKQRR